jgi:hypothetical protein
LKESHKAENIQIWINYNYLQDYITKVEKGVDQSRSRGTELPCMFREGLSLLMRILSRMRSSSGEEQQEIILKSLREAV